MRPVFVLGAPYAGTSLLAWSLAQHPSFAPRLERRAVADIVDAARLLRLLERRLPELALAAGEGRPERWVTASPAYVFHLEALSRIFPGAQFVHLVRDVEETLRAAVQRRAHEPDVVVAAWLRAVEAGVAAERALGARTVLRVSFDRLKAAPEAEVARCLRFLGEPFAEACLWPLRALGRPQLLGEDIPPVGVPEAARALSVALLSRRPRYAGRKRGAAELRAKERGAPSHAPLLDEEAAVRPLVAAAVPRGDVVLVISHGVDELVRFDDQEGRHFPQTAEGEYGGKPRSSEEAVLQLGQLRQQGARFLVVPQSASWWLEFYEGFREHLEGHCRLVLAGDSCRIYELEAAPARVPAEEPDIAGAFLTTSPTPPRKSPAVLPGELWAITAFFNPARYRNKRENYRRFREGVRAAGLPLLAVETAFGDDEFELGSGDADVLVQLRADDVLWQKERMLNVAIRRLPPECDKVAWLDADVLLTNPRWPAEAARRLETYEVVQPYSHCVRLERGQTWVDPATLPFGTRQENALFYGVAFGVQAHGRASLADFRVSGHTGFAWSARRALLERHGLYDRRPLGNGDNDIAKAMWGYADYPTFRKLSPNAQRDLRKWARGFAADVDGSVSYVAGLLLHLWHGSGKDRLYSKRLAPLREFDPARNLEVDPVSGLYRWRDVPPAVRDWSRSYFAQRREE